MKTCSHFQFRGLTAKREAGQRGVVLLFTLIALTVMMIGAVGLISSIKSSMISAGNIGFKRDLVNRAEEAAAQVLWQFNNAGFGLETTALRGNNNTARNYSAVALPTTPQGIPTDLLLNDSAFALNWTQADINVGGGVTLRYVVDRLCTRTGDSQQLQVNECVRAPQQGGLAKTKAMDESGLKRRAEGGLLDSAGSPGVRMSPAQPAAYRLTVRGTGARDTQAFYQIVFTEPTPP